MLRREEWGTPRYVVELFRAAARRAHAPLAERMRPQTLDDWVGDSPFAAEGELGASLRAGFVPSLLLVGPPGCGKTTLARLLARTTGRALLELSATSAGMADLRAVLERASAVHSEARGAPLLFVDEVHRLNKAQQDALLPHVENGAVVFIGATTEAPGFAVRRALLSRLHIIALGPLAEDSVQALLQRALYDEDKGVGRSGIQVDDSLLRMLAKRARGDGRRALALLETLVNAAAAKGLREASEDLLPSAMLEQLAYDGDGQWHYDCASAFIKSMRASQASDALYWQERMLQGGEDPRFIARRMLIFASEDIGNADAQAILVAHAASEALERLGMPEARYALAQCCLYLARATKSRETCRAIERAREDVTRRGDLPVPAHLRNT